MVWFTKYLPITIIIFSAIILNMAMFKVWIKRVKALVELIRTDYIAAQKRLYWGAGASVSQQITHTQRLVEDEVKKRITRRLDRTPTAAQNIYSSNQHLPEDKLKQLILNEIRSWVMLKNKNISTPMTCRVRHSFILLTQKLKTPINLRQQTLKVWLSSKKQIEL